jgi:ferredoxin-NADP reductase
VLYILGAPGSDTDVLVDRRLSSVVTELDQRDVFVCGPPRFMDAARDSLLRCGVDASRIHAEHFTF